MVVDGCGGVRVACVGVGVNICTLSVVYVEMRQRSPRVRQSPPAANLSS